MRPAIARLSTSSRRKLTSILLAVAIFASLAMLTTPVLGRPVINGLSNAIICRHRRRVFRGILCAEPARSLAAQHAPAEIPPDLCAGRGRALFTVHPPDPPDPLGLEQPTVGLSTLSDFAADRDHLFGRRDRRHAGRPFHRHRNSVSPDDRHLSPPGGRKKGPDDINDSTALA